MIQLLLRTLLIALALFTFFPALAGIKFHGNLLSAGVLAVATTAASFLLHIAFDLCERKLTTLIRHLKLKFAVGLLIMSPVWIFGFFILPGLLLKLLSNLFPELLSVESAGSILAGGVILYLITYMTGGFSHYLQSCWCGATSKKSCPSQASKGHRCPETNDQNPQSGTPASRISPDMACGEKDEEITQ